MESIKSQLHRGGIERAHRERRPTSEISPAQIVLTGINYMHTVISFHSYLFQTNLSYKQLGLINPSENHTLKLTFSLVPL